MFERRKSLVKVLLSRNIDTNCWIAETSTVANRWTQFGRPRTAANECWSGLGQLELTFTWIASASSLQTTTTNLTISSADDVLGYNPLPTLPSSSLRGAAIRALGAEQGHAYIASTYSRAATSGTVYTFKHTTLAICCGPPHSTLVCGRSRFAGKAAATSQNHPSFIMLRIAKSRKTNPSTFWARRHCLRHTSEYESVIIDLF